MAMNFREGTRRLALLLGIVGAILGGFASYVELQPVMRQRADHQRFEQLANSPVVQQARKSCFDKSSESEHGPWEKYQTPQKNLPPLPTGATIVPPYCYMPNDDPDAFYYTPSELNSGGTKTIHFENREIASIETTDGQTLYPTAAPGVWPCFLIAIFPVLGFFVPWGAIRAIGWVGTGFSQPTT
jgi:hypothetical protein